MRKMFSALVLALIFTSCNETERKAVPSLPDTDENLKAVTDSHSDIMETVSFKKHTIETIGILVYDGVNSLDVFGPRYVLNQIMGVDLKMIALKPGNVKTVMGIEFVPDAIIDDIDTLDILVIPGGAKGTIEASYNKKLQQWIRQIDQNSTYTTSVCTGGWILGSTGLLKGRRATTNWFQAEEFLTKYGAEFTNERFTRDGKYWTSAGVSAGMDMSLALLDEIAGRDYAQGVMLDMEYDPAPPFEGGSPEKTSPKVLNFMTTMYKAGIDPIIKKLEEKE